MTSNEMKNIYEQLQLQCEMSLCDGAREEQIVAFENEHRIIFPEKFKEWLLLSDGGELFLPAGIQVYGVSHKPAIDVNDDDRPDDDYIVIGALSSGDTIVYKNGEERVSIYNREANRIEDDETYSDFASFLTALYVLLGIGD